MTRALPAALSSAMDSGKFTPYIAKGKRNYTYDEATGLPDAFVSFTTLITSILYYWYDGLKLKIIYSSANLPADDGLIIGHYYHIERGIAGSTIKSASLRFDKYTINKQHITAYFSLFSENIPSATPNVGDTYTQALTTYNPTTIRLGSSLLRTSPENTNHWSYVFNNAAVTLSRQSDLLPFISQKYLVHAVDASDNTYNDGVLYFHLNNPDQSEIFASGTVPTGTWQSVCWSASLSLFVIVSGDGKVATSPDGETWTSRTAAEANYWRSVCWSPEHSLFCAVAASGTNRVMTSPDGITWTARSASAANTWQAVSWSPELSLFVSVASSGTNRAMTSPDGITWTARTIEAKTWNSVCWSPALTLFVAVNVDVSGNRVSTSPDGITWTSRTGPASFLNDVVWSPDLSYFLAHSTIGVYKSLDGITWIQTESFSSGNYVAICWNSSTQKFVMCSQASPSSIVSSPDGATWSEIFNTNNYQDITYSAELNKIVAIGTNVSAISQQADAPDHTITRADVILESNGENRSYKWTDGTSDFTSGSGKPHNLGYIASGNYPPRGYGNSPEAKVEIGIHLKYRSGDLIKLVIQTGQDATYLAEVIEVYDPKEAMTWKNIIKLMPRFEGSTAQAPTSGDSIYAPSPWTPL